MHQKRLISSLILLGLPLVYGPAVYAAKPVDLNQQPTSFLQSLIHSNNAFSADNLNIEETKRSVDLKKTLHIRFKQTYQGRTIWGADGVIHVPHGAATSLQQAFSSNLAKGAMDGTVYQGIKEDLAATSPQVFSDAQAQKAVKEVLGNFQIEKGAHPEITEVRNELVVFVDESNKAHWAYHVSFYASPTKAGEIPAKPNYIVDAATFKTYVTWDNIKTIGSSAAYGGGYGGNKKMGKVTYDGLEKNFARLNILRDDDAKNCYLQNPDVKVKKCTQFSWGQCRQSKDFFLPCEKTDPEHNDVYWNGDLDQVNGGYSPSNDALFNGAVIKDLYEKWYGVPVLEQNGKPMLLTMVVHLPMDNAYWDGKTMNFGDGISYFYPLTSLGVAAHEISHGFTEQHADLNYYGQSGGMNEAFSDMAAQAAEVYAYNKNSWQIGPEIFKAEDQALRYMDKPSKDCRGRKPGSRCSIDDASQYYSGLDVHYSSGVYNRLFYLLATAEGWNVKKAFDVMVTANSNYWTASSTWEKGGCGLIKAAKDLDYNAKDVIAALNGVKVSTSSCT